jgi:hypothetical protein
MLAICVSRAQKASSVEQSQFLHSFSSFAQPSQVYSSYINKLNQLSIPAKLFVVHLPPAIDKDNERAKRKILTEVAAVANRRI